MSFPLPLTPFESLMFLDAREEFPMVFYIIYELRGVVDRSRLEKAFSLVRVRHPLLNALVRWNAGGLEWVLANSIPPSLDWGSIDQPSFPVADKELNLVDRPGLHLTVLEKGDQSQLVLRGHHSCCDGMGVFLFLDELLSAYHQLSTNPSGEVTLTPLNPDALQHRGEFGGEVDPDAPPVGPWRAAWNYFQEVRKFFFYFPSPVKSAQPQSDGGLPCRSCVLSEEVVARLRRAALHANVQLNDLLLREGFLNIQSWNGHRGRWRVTMPVAMRDQRHVGSSAANILSYAFLHRTNAECSDPDALLKGIAWETGTIKKYRLGGWFLTGLALATKYPRLLRWATRWNVCFATIVLSNISDPTRRSLNLMPRDESGRLIAGNLVLENILAVPPVRPKTRLTMAVSTYAGRMTITAMGCPKTFGPAAVQQFIDAYGRRLERLADGVTEPSVPTVSS